MLRRAAEEDASAQALEGKPEVHGVAHGHEGHRDEDEHAKGFGVGCQDHHDEVQEVQEVVHGVLDAVNHPALRLRHALLDELRHGKVERPKAWKGMRVREITSCTLREMSPKRKNNFIFLEFGL